VKHLAVHHLALEPWKAPFALDQHAQGKRWRFPRPQNLIP